jgi:hypothetical protein
MAQRASAAVPAMQFSDPAVRMRCAGAWITQQVSKHPELDPAHETLLLGARQVVNEWLESKPTDKTAWLQDEHWMHYSGSAEAGSTLHGRLALRFLSCDENQRNCVMIHAGDSVLAVVREAGQEEDYLLYDPRTAQLARYGALDALCQSTFLKGLNVAPDLYYPTTAAPLAPIPFQAPLVPAPPIRAKKPPAKKRSAPPAAAAAAAPASPLKKLNSDSAPVAVLVEESSGETAK